MKPKIIAYSENVLGGIQNFYVNLLSHQSDSFFEVDWFLINHCNELRTVAPKYKIQSKIVNYCLKDGQWRRARKLIEIIGDAPGIILANREYELDALYLFPVKNKTVCHIVHDDYYLQFALKYQNVIDFYIAHNKFIYHELISALPNRSNNIHFLPFGIELPLEKRASNLENKLKIVFIARLAIEKGIHDLSKIDDILKYSNCRVEWLIIGDGPEKDNFLNTIKSRDNFNYKWCEEQSEIYKLIKDCDVFVLPSILDGTPLALLESMSVGLVPILYEFNLGIKEIVGSELGFVVNKGCFEEIAESITTLHHNRELLENMSSYSLNYARNNFDVIKRSNEYYDLFKNYMGYKHDMNYSGVNPIRIFDKLWFPESLFAFLRSLKGLIKTK
jgi:glycosyltransferase involved in cell wall biosynthesis